MKTRTINVDPDAIRIEGTAWGKDPIALVFETYDNGMIIRRARVRMRPIDLQDLANRLWEVRDKYQREMDDMTRALRRPS